MELFCFIFLKVNIGLEIWIFLLMKSFLLVCVFVEEEIYFFMVMLLKKDLLVCVDEFIVNKIVWVFLFFGILLVYVV